MARADGHLTNKEMSDVLRQLSDGHASNVVTFQFHPMGFVDPESREFLGFSVPFDIPSVCAYIVRVDGEWKERV